MKYLVVFFALVGVAGCAMDATNTTELTSSTEGALERQLVEGREKGYSGGLFGYRWDGIVGQHCSEGFRQGDLQTWVTGGGHCELAWYSQDPLDCRALLHIGCSAFRSGTCHYRIYEDPR